MMIDGQPRDRRRPQGGRHRPTESGADRGSSSTLGSLVLVGLVAALAGGSIAVAFSIGPIVPDAKTAAFGFDYEDDRTADTLQITHQGGNRLLGDRMTIVVENADPPSADGTYTWTGPPLNGAEEITASDSVVLNASTIGDGSQLDLHGARVVMIRDVPGENRTVIAARWTGSDWREG